VPTPEEFFRAGALAECRQALEERLREKPQEEAPRIFYFQLLLALCEWDRAQRQLQTLESLGAINPLFSKVFTGLIQAERFRAEVFAGQRAPLLLGEPPKWVASLVEALKHPANSTAAASLRAQALAEAEPTGGRCNDETFAWVMDGDARLGPVLEVILEGQYYWVPFAVTRKISLEKPQDLRDFVWAPGQFTWVNGGQVAGHMPVRYPFPVSPPPAPAGLLAKITEWEEVSSGQFLGRGQRRWLADTGEYALLETRQMELDHE
jgi:type VI secretion system protein ImpE